MMLELDHLAVAAETLAEGVEYVEDLLGVKMTPGGKHPLMGTHNQLLSLGPRAYLEVIAIDPGAPAPAHPRWFDLDRFSGAPRMTNWIARTDDLAGARAKAPDGVGDELALSRGDLRWRMLVPDDGILPFDGAYPALISWDGSAHPAAMLAYADCLFESLRIDHPDSENVTRSLEPVLDMDGISIKTTEKLRLTAEVRTKNGLIELS